MAGRLFEKKGFAGLMDAVRELGGCTCEIVGDGPLGPELRRQATEAGLGDRVAFTGWLEPEQFFARMAESDVLVVPSVVARDGDRDGVPNVVLEALSCGTPVVASRVGAVPDLLDEDCGIIVQPEDPGALRRALRTALSREWDRAALRRHTEGMSWESNAEKLHSILSGVAGGSDRPAEADADEGRTEGHGHERN